MKTLFALAAATLLLGLQPSAGTGALAGRVQLEGAPPPPSPPTPVAKPADAAVCGSLMAGEGVIAGEQGAVKNVIVYLEGVKAAAAPPSKLSLANHGCRFEPHVQTATVGSSLAVRNDDAILHNTHAYLEPDNTLFNVALPFKGVEITRPLSKTGLLRFKCDAGHTWMSAYVMVLPHRFHAVSDAEGRFRIEGVPPGSYSAKIWHEVLGPRSVTASIEAGRETELAIKLPFDTAGRPGVSSSR